MVSKQSRSEIRRKKHYRLRNRFAGTTERPRLAVFRSNNHMYAQIIDDTVGHTLVSASTLEKEIKAELENTDTVEAAAHVGTVIAKRALEKGITEVVFDRGGFIYHGKVTVAVANHMLKIGLALLHHNDIYCTAKEDNCKKLKAKLAGYKLSALSDYLPQ